MRSRSAFEPVKPWRAALTAALLGLAGSAAAVDWTGRVSVLGSVSIPARGDAGNAAAHVPSADQQGLRLMAQDQGERSEWSLHLDAARSNQRALVGAAPQASDLFRWRRLADSHLGGDGIERSTRIGWAIDRAVFKRRFGQASLALGRQPVDFGSGRFWQPLNVFGAFAPTDLDTDYKPGIDAAVLDIYPSAFSSLTAVVALAPRHQLEIEDSVALHYRRQVGETSQLALLAAQVVGQRQVGAAFESDWRGIGWRVEGLHTRPEGGGAGSLFWIAGADYQFNNGTLVALEWHDDARGATHETTLAEVAARRPVVLGLQQQWARRVFGLSVQKDLTPLLNASYTLLASRLRAADGQHAVSVLHQLSLVRSLSNESDLLISAAFGSGRGLDPAGAPGSSFGHLPPTATLRWRRYF